MIWPALENIPAFFPSSILGAQFLEACSPSIRCSSISSPREGLSEAVAGLPILPSGISQDNCEYQEAALHASFLY